VGAGFRDISSFSVTVAKPHSERSFQIVILDLGAITINCKQSNSEPSKYLLRTI